MSIPFCSGRKLHKCTFYPSFPCKTHNPFQSLRISKSSGLSQPPPEWASCNCTKDYPDGFPPCPYIRETPTVCIVRRCSTPALEIYPRWASTGGGSACVSRYMSSWKEVAEPAPAKPKTDYDPIFQFRVRPATNQETGLPISIDKDLDCWTAQNHTLAQARCYGFLLTTRWARRECSHLRLNFELERGVRGVGQKAVFRIFGPIGHRAIWDWDGRRCPLSFGERRRIDGSLMQLFLSWEC